MLDLSNVIRLITIIINVLAVLYFLNQLKYWNKPTKKRIMMNSFVAFLMAVSEICKMQVEETIVKANITKIFIIIWIILLVCNVIEYVRFSNKVEE